MDTDFLQITKSNILQLNEIILDLKNQMEL